MKHPFTRIAALLALLLLPIGLLSAQTHQHQHGVCGADEVNARYDQHNPQAIQQREAVFQNFRSHAPSAKTSSAERRTWYTIPVVVHVIYGQASGNADSIPLEQIEAGIKVLNEDYRRIPGTMGFGAGADMNIEFSLATLDPNGNPTTGVNYHFEPSLANLDRSSGVEAQIKNRYVWDRTRYANVWLVNQISSFSSGGTTLGFAYFPSNGNQFDGVTMRSDTWGSTEHYQRGNYFGGVGYGRTGSHEFGHWLNLLHPFQGGCGSNNCRASGDRICDTPPTANRNFGSGNQRQNSCNTDNPELPDNVRNIMDYTDDYAVNHFTPEQRAVAHFVLSQAGNYTFRKDLYSEANLEATGTGPWGQPYAYFWADNRNPCLGQPVTFSDFAIGSPTEYTWRFPGGQRVAGSPDTAPQVIYNRGGSYDVELIVTNRSGRSDTMLKPNFITVDGHTLKPPFFENFESANFPPTAWAVQNPDAHKPVGAMPWQTKNGLSARDIGQRCAQMNNYYYPDQGQRDQLLTTRIDASDNDHLLLTFDLAYRNVQSNQGGFFAKYNDSLEVHVSTDCGETWTRVYNKGGDSLRTTSQPSDEGSNFRDPAVSEWRRDSVVLDSFANTANLRIKFEAIAGFGNNLYLDNVRLDTVQLYTAPVVTSRPDPLQGETPTIQYGPNGAQLFLPLAQSAEVDARLLDIQGRVVQQWNPQRYPAGEQHLSLDLPHTASLYLLQLQVAGQPYVLKAVQP